MKYFLKNYIFNTVHIIIKNKFKLCIIMGIIDIVKDEIKRYQRRGLVWSCIAFAYLAAFHYFGLKLGKYAWPKILEMYEDKDTLCFLISPTLNIITMLVLEIFYNTIYSS